MLDVGEVAPLFAAHDQNEKLHSLEDYLGQWVILYFYPKDDTPGCTKEACEFRDNFDGLNDLKAVLLGVSPDGVESHKKFVDKYDLSFPLLSDPDKEIVRAYGVWGEKVRYGKKSVGLIRTTYLITPEGKIAKGWANVRVEGHVDRVINELRTQSA